MYREKQKRRMTKGRLFVAIFIFATAFAVALCILLRAIYPSAEFLPYMLGAAVGIVFLFGALFVWESQQDLVPAAETFNQFPLAFALLDYQRRFRWINPAAQKLLGLDGASLLGRAWDEVLRALCPESSDASIPDEGVRRDVRRPDGSVFTLEYLAVPLGASTPVAADNHFILLLRDAGRLLEVLREESENTRLRTAACLATQIAHEVLNPVAAISGSAQVLGHLNEKARRGDQRSLELLDHERDVLCRSIVEESARLDGIVSRFLSFTTLSEENIRQAMQFEPTGAANSSIEKSAEPVAAQ